MQVGMNEFPVLMARSSRPRFIDSHVVTDLLPTHYLTVHQSAIRVIAWIRVPSNSGSEDPMVDENPTIVVSGGYDGMECLTDIREVHRSVMNRTRGPSQITCYLCMF